MFGYGDQTPSKERGSGGSNMPVRRVGGLGGRRKAGRKEELFASLEEEMGKNRGVTPLQPPEKGRPLRGKLERNGKNTNGIQQATGEATT